MPVAVEISTTPGLADLAAGELSLQVSVDDALAEFLATPGVANTPVEAEAKAALAHAEEEAGEQEDAEPQGVDAYGYRERVRAFGWLDGLRRFFAPEEHQVVGVEDHTVELAAYWLTVPAVAGAAVTLSIEVTNSHKTAASVKIAGIGGGPTFDVAVKQGLEHPATTDQRATLTTSGTFQRIDVVKDGTLLGTYARLVALDQANVDWAFPHASPPDASELGAVTGSTGYDLTGNSKSDTVILQLSRGTTWDMSAGIKLASLGGIEACVSGQVSYEQDVGYTYELPPHHRYRATRYDAFPAYIWTLQ